MESNEKNWRDKVWSKYVIRRQRPIDEKNMKENYIKPN